MHAATGLKALAAAPGCAPTRISEAIRLRLAAALLDLGNHLMLSADERKAFRLRGWLPSARARRLGVAAAAVRAGARRLDEVNPGDPDRRAHAGGQPGRALALSCVVYEPPDRGASNPPEKVPTLFWRVVNGAPPGYCGHSVTVEVPQLHRVLLAYYARSPCARGAPPEVASSTRTSMTKRWPRRKAQATGNPQPAREAPNSAVGRATAPGPTGWPRTRRHDSWRLRDTNTPYNAF